MALRGVSQANLDLVVLQDTKFIYVVYTHELASYSVVSMGALIRHCGGVAVFHRVLPRFSAKALQQFGTNVIRFHLVKGGSNGTSSYATYSPMTPRTFSVSLWLLESAPVGPNFWWPKISTLISRAQKEQSRTNKF